MLHVRGLFERGHCFLRILRCAARGGSFGRTSAAGLGTAIHGHGSERCRSFGLPDGAHHWPLFSLALSLQQGPVRPLSRFSVDLPQRLLHLVLYGVGGIFETFAVDLRLIWRLIVPVWILLRLALFPLSLFLMYKAFRNQCFSLPFIGPLAAKLAG